LQLKISWDPERTEWSMLESGEHASALLCGKRGLEPVGFAAMKDSIESGDKPRVAVRKAQKVIVETSASPPTALSSADYQKKIKAASNARYRAGQKLSQRLGLNTVPQLEQYLLDNKTTKENFDCKGTHLINKK